MADSGFLICLFIVWLTYLNINLYNRNGICQIVVYLTYVFSFVSVWLIVAFTIERFIAIYFPFQRPSVCTVKRAKMNIIIIVTIGFILYPFILFSAGIIYPIKEENLYKTYNYSLNNDKIIMAYYKFTNDNRTRANINDNNISSNSWIIFRSHINIYDKRHHFYSNSNLYFEKTIYHNESQIKTYKFMESGKYGIQDEIEPECTLKLEYIVAMNIFNHIDNFVTLFIPFAILITFNIMICRKIVFFLKSHSYLYKENEISSDSYSNVNNRNNLQKIPTKCSKSINLLYKFKQRYDGCKKKKYTKNLPNNLEIHQLMCDNVERNEEILNNKINIKGIKFKLQPHSSIIHTKESLCKFVYDSKNFPHSFKYRFHNPQANYRVQSKVICYNSKRKGILTKTVKKGFPNIFTRSQMSITKLVLIISSVFLLLNFPSYILRIRVYIMNLAYEDYKYTKKFTILEKFFLLLYYTNFSINFLLYSACGTKFRKVLVCLFKNNK
ncbi:uncharacterized protein LOC135924792 [Gordionus sp. m RMFG-2023]|uniref:uncharacterized protein LOC135924792 n=1 Tax=Gordionus sp. m RMFG-2023 TaxID=3053472 RepID=UPI0031FD604C